MSLFTVGGSGTGGGEKYEYVPDGFYGGVLVAFEEGPTFNDPETGQPQPKIRWKWELYDNNGNPVVHEGQPVVISDITSTKTGEKSTAAKWFSAHLKRQFNNRTDNVDVVEQECIGKKVNLVITTKTSGYKKIDVFPSSN